MSYSNRRQTTHEVSGKASKAIKLYPIRSKIMAHAEGKITIARPIQEVFNFILDGANNPHWRPAVLEIRQTSSTPLGLGSTFKQVLKGPGGRIDCDYEIVQYRPNERIKIQVTAGPPKPNSNSQVQH